MNYPMPSQPRYLMTTTTLLSLSLACNLASAVPLPQALVIVNANIATSTTWTAGNIYQLATEVYVEPGATLTIEPGTVIASAPGGSLTIARCAQIFANGTAESPIIFTSTADRATWVGGDPTTGVFRPLASNEWGNVVILGSGYISANLPTTTPFPNGANRARMVGLTSTQTILSCPGSQTTGIAEYGGNNDNDDSGDFTYVSLRYGGLTSAPGVELNGLGIGAVGRGTTIHNIEVLNSGDDGIHIWGGTVSFKFLSVWNAGDDSIDIDQGYRGKMQFGLLVQGWSNAGPQSFGFGDNAIEVDGADLASYQPCTTTALHNFTVIGLPPISATNSSAGDSGVFYTDNANLQVRNSIFMDIGDSVIGGGIGYGTPGWAARWTTPFNYYASGPTPNQFAPPEISPTQAYTAQIDGNLIDWRDNVLYRNIRTNAYSEANARAVFTGGAGTANANNAIVASLPIAAIVRGAFVSPNGVNTSAAVTFLDPTPANDALTSVQVAPNDGFYTSHRVRGAFPRGNNWLIGWTATSRFGLTSNNKGNVYLGGERAGLVGAPAHSTDSTWLPGAPVTFRVDNIDPSVNVAVFVLGGPTPLSSPVYGGTLIPSPDYVDFRVGTGGSAVGPTFNLPAGLTGQVFHTQFVSFDLGVPIGEFAFSNAQRHTAQ